MIFAYIKTLDNVHKASPPVEKILPLEDKFVWLHYIQKENSSNIHNVIKYLTIRLSGDNTATQVCALCVLY